MRRNTEHIAFIFIFYGVIYYKIKFTKGLGLLIIVSHYYFTNKVLRIYIVNSKIYLFI